MFITIVKSPTVKKMIGAEMRLRTGLMKKLIKPKIKPAVKSGMKLFSGENENPETTCAAI